MITVSQICAVKNPANLEGEGMGTQHDVSRHERQAKYPTLEVTMTS